MEIKKNLNTTHNPKVVLLRSKNTLNAFRTPEELQMSDYTKQLHFPCCLAAVRLSTRLRFAHQIKKSFSFTKQKEKNAEQTKFTTILDLNGKHAKLLIIHAQIPLKSLKSFEIMHE